MDDNEPDQMGNYIDQLAADYLSYAPGYPVTDLYDISSMQEPAKWSCHIMIPALFFRKHAQTLDWINKYQVNESSENEIDIGIDDWNEIAKSSPINKTHKVMSKTHTGPLNGRRSPKRFQEITAE